MYINTMDIKTDSQIHKPARIFDSLLIVGGTGSVGESFLRVLTKRKTDVMLHIVSRSKTRQTEMSAMFPNVTFHLADMADRKQMTKILQEVRPSNILIAAGMIGVATCEEKILESISSNVTTLTHCIDTIQTYACTELGLRNVVYVSSGNACHPINVYGLCKALAEKLIICASKNKTNVKWAIVRLGNLMDTQHGILNKYRKIAQDPTQLCFPIFHHGMTRFFMTADESADLISDALKGAQNGEIWIREERGTSVFDIAQFFSQQYNKPIQVLSWKEGEKVHECLINDSERDRTRRVGNYWAITTKQRDDVALKHSLSSDICRPFHRIETEIRRIVGL